MWVSKKTSHTRAVNIHEFTALHERLKAKQVELFDHLTQDPSAAVTPALERLLHILDWVRLEHYMDDGCGQGRPPRDHFAIANATNSSGVAGAIAHRVRSRHQMQCAGLQE